VVAPALRARPDPDLLETAAASVRELVADYEPPRFSSVPDEDAALFLCAIDHKAGYGRAYLVGGRGPFRGSALLWELGLLAAQRHPGLLTAERLADIDAEELAELFRIGGETVEGADVRARLWRELATGLQTDYEGSTEVLLASAGGRLGGPEGLLERLAAFEAFADPLQKKSFLFAKIAERRGWLRVEDPESWQVCADSVLMRLALRSGLVAPGPEPEVRAATRDALRLLAERAEVSPQLLDDLLWERGRDDSDLLGAAVGDELGEPPREPGSHWY
jgi:hypothetical protein